MTSGFSLPIVMFMITLGGALGVGGAFVSRQIATSARAQARGIGLDGLAEGSAVRTLTDWDSTAAADQVIGASRTISEEAGAQGRTTVWLTRVTTDVYLITVEAETVSKPLLRRRLALTVVIGQNGRLSVPRRAWGDLP